jgi:hypothetical protein
MRAQVLRTGFAGLSRPGLPLPSPRCAPTVILPLPYTDFHGNNIFY